MPTFFHPLYGFFLFLGVSVSLTFTLFSPLQAEGRAKQSSTFFCSQYAYPLNIRVIFSIQIAVFEKNH